MLIGDDPRHVRALVYRQVHMVGVTIDFILGSLSSFACILQMYSSK
jgi:hypothetical protein